MPDYPWLTATRFAPVLLLLAVMVLSRVIIGRQMSRRGAVDRTRLRASLAVELAAVRDLLEDNLGLIAGCAGYVVSSRGSFLLFRASASRLAVLDADELAALLGAHGANERLEARLAVTGKPSGPSAFRVPAEETALAEIRQAVLHTQVAIEAALRILERPPAVVRWFRGRAA